MLLGTFVRKVYERKAEVISCVFEVSLSRNVIW
jgi:hypothetical protein